MEHSSEPRLPLDFHIGRLRRLRPDDLAEFQAYRRIPEVGRYQGWTPMSDADALAFLVEMRDAPLFAPGQWVQMGIAESGRDGLIGDIGVYVSEDARDGEIGFTLDPAAQGRGIATEAVRTALGLLFASTRVTRVLGITDRRNCASIRLLERVGFAYQETREADFRGEPCSERVYALSRPGG